MEQLHADQEHHKWLLDEEEEVQEEETALVGRHSREHPKDNVNPGVPETYLSSSSSSSATSIGIGNNGDGVSLVGTDTEVSDGLLFQKEEQVAEMENPSENGYHCDDHKVDSGALLEHSVAEEFAGAAANGDTVTGSIIGDVSMNKIGVYFDNQEGTEANNGSSGAQNGDGARSDPPTSSGDGEFIMQEEKSDIQNILRNGVNIRCVKTVEDQGPSSSEILPFDNSSEVKGITVMHINNEITTKGSPELIEEIDQQLKELDVEAVLAKQETYDLFCPNCHSCITKRVLLRKRKRHAHNLESKAKRDKSNDAISSKPMDGSANEANRGDQAITNSDVASIEPPAYNNSPEKEAEVFRCLSCFSFFIPTGNSFNLFRNFGGGRERETSEDPLIIPVSNTQDPSDISAAKANWFFSLFTSNRGKTATKKDDADVDHTITGPAEQNHSSSISSNMPSSPEIGYPQGPISDTNTTENGKPISNIKPEHGGTGSLISSAVDSVKIGSRIEEDFKFNVSAENESLADRKSLNSLFQNDSSFKQPSTQIVGDVINGVQKVRHDLIDFPANEHFLIGNVTINVGKKNNDWAVIPKTGSPILEKSYKDIEKIPDITTADKSIAQSSNFSFMQGKQPLASDAATDIQSSGVDTKISSKQDFKLAEKAREDLGEDPASSKETKGDEVIVFVEEEAVKSTRSQTVANVPVGGAILTETPTQEHIGDQRGAQNAEPRGWEILKSIVYGGLIESITSLGIVSSAVGSGASPLNIIALGLANLIGGLFIIIDNLIELKNDNSRGNQQQTNTQEEDRYQELLGRRSNFILHAVVAVLSFIIFGTVPIVIYGVLIRKNYSTEIKLAAVATASLICIILLAIGKVYTKRSPKSYFKTVFYYVTIALAAAGVSNVAGGLIKDLLEKFNKSESSFVIEMPFSSTGRMEPAWMSY